MANKIMNKWEDFFEIVEKGNFRFHAYYVFSITKQRVVSNPHPSRSSAVRHAKGLFTKIERKIEKDLLGE